MIDACPARDSVAGAPHSFKKRVCEFCGMRMEDPGMKQSAEKQAQERADREKKTCFAWFYEGIWYVRTAEEGRPTNAVLITTKEPQ